MLNSRARLWICLVLGRDRTDSERRAEKRRRSVPGPVHRQKRPGERARAYPRQTVPSGEWIKKKKKKFLYCEMMKEPDFNQIPLQFSPEAKP